MKKKVCSRCKEEKDVTEFSSKRNQCKECIKELKREYYRNNPEKEKKRLKVYYDNNREKVIKRNTEYNFNNKEKISIRKKNSQKDCGKDKGVRNEYYREYKRGRRLSDPLYKVSENIRLSIVNCFRKGGYNKKSKTHKILGCTYDEFKTYIESQWEEWMNWDNYGKYNGEERYGWDLDHIIPMSSGKCEEDIVRLNHHSNIQPLCSYINRYVKRDKIEKGVSNVFDIVE
jgi:hypothetical protein